MTAKTTKMFVIPKIIFDALLYETCYSIIVIKMHCTRESLISHIFVVFSVAFSPRIDPASESFFCQLRP